jgi:hypothetical protein
MKTLYYNNNLLEEVESGEALDAESFSDCLLLGGVDLCEEIGRVILGELLSCLSVLWGQGLAVTAIS